VDSRVRVARAAHQRCQSLANGGRLTAPGEQRQPDDRNPQADRQPVRPAPGQPHREQRARRGGEHGDHRPARERAEDPGREPGRQEEHQDLAPVEMGQERQAAPTQSGRQAVAGTKAALRRGPLLPGVAPQDPDAGPQRARQGDVQKPAGMIPVDVRAKGRAAHRERHRPVKPLVPGEPLHEGEERDCGAVGRGEDQQPPHRDALLEAHGPEEKDAGRQEQQDQVAARGGWVEADRLEIGFGGKREAGRQGRVR